MNKMSGKYIRKVWRSMGAEVLIGQLVRRQCSQAVPESRKQLLGVSILLNAWKVDI